MALWQGLSELCVSDERFYLIPCGPDPLATISHAEDLAPCTLVIKYSVLSQCREQLRAALQRIPGLVVMVCGELEDTAQEELITMGVVGFVPEFAGASELYKALKAVARGEVWASRRVTSNALMKLVFQSNAKPLSEREIEILRNITHGYKNREIADRLCISRDTVRWHIRSLYSKIGASDRLSAVMYGRRFLLSVDVTEASREPIHQ